MVFLMTLAGTGIAVPDLAAALRRPGLLAAATAGQVLVLPGVALATGWILAVDPALAIGLLLIGTAPGGALSNVYTYILGADVALSVALTATSTLAAVVTMPLMLELAISRGLGNDVEVALPGGRIALQLFATLVLPTVAGMLLRRRHAAFFVTQARRLRAAGLAVVGGVVLLVLVVNLAALTERWIELLASSLLYTALAGAAGTVFAGVATTDRSVRVALAIEFSCRNTPAALLVASLALGRDDFAVFAAVLLVVQSPLLLGLARSLAPPAQRAAR